MFWAGMLTLPSISGPAGPARQPVIDDTWPAALIHRAGYAIFFAALVPAAPLWPLASMLLPLALLTIGWDLLLDETPAPRAAWIAAFQERVAPWWHPWQARLTGRWRWIARWQAWRPGRYLLPLALILAFLSLLGFPFTVGMRDRWPLYAALLRHQSPWLVLVLIADAWLAAGIWRVARGRPAWLRRERPPAFLSLFALVVLALTIVAGGLAPGFLGLAPAGTGRVSGWGLGFFVLLPWLIGAWFGRLDGQLARYIALARRFVTLDWLYTWAGRVAGALLGFFYWLGRVAEGAGWWGWALIMLALGAALLAVR